MSSDAVCTRSKTAKMRAIKRVYIKKKNEGTPLRWEEFLGENPVENLNLRQYMNPEEYEETIRENQEVQVKDEQLFTMPIELYDYYIKKFVIERDSNEKIKIVIEKSKTTIIDLTLEEDVIDNMMKGDFAEDYELEDVKPTKTLKPGYKIPKLNQKKSNETNQKEVKKVGFYHSQVESLKNSLRSYRNLTKTTKVLIKPTKLVEKEFLPPLQLKPLKKQKKSKQPQNKEPPLARVPPYQTSTSNIRSYNSKYLPRTCVTSKFNYGNFWSKSKPKKIEEKRRKGESRLKTFELLAHDLYLSSEDDDEQTKLEKRRLVMEGIEEKVQNSDEDNNNKGDDKMEHIEEDKEDVNEADKNLLELYEDGYKYVEPTKLETVSPDTTDSELCNSDIEPSPTSTLLLSSESDEEKDYSVNNMSENGDEILHYKKRLIHLHDVSRDAERPPPIMTEEVSETKVTTKRNLDSISDEEDELGSSPKGKNGKTPRKKRKSQKHFRHQSMEFYKLGNSDNSTSLCKSKDSYKVSQEKFLKSASENSKTKNVPKQKLTEDILQTLGNSPPSVKHPNLPQVITRQSSRTNVGNKVDESTHVSKPVRIENNLLEEAKKNLNNLKRNLCIGEGMTLHISKKIPLIPPKETPQITEESKNNGNNVNVNIVSGKIPEQNIPNENTTNNRNTGNIIINGNIKLNTIHIPQQTNYAQINEDVPLNLSKPNKDQTPNQSTNQKPRRESIHKPNPVGPPNYQETLHLQALQYQNQMMYQRVNFVQPKPLFIPRTVTNQLRRLVPPQQPKVPQEKRSRGRPRKLSPLVVQKPGTLNYRPVNEYPVGLLTPPETPVNRQFPNGYDLPQKRYVVDNEYQIRFPNNFVQTSRENQSNFAQHQPKPSTSTEVASPPKERPEDPIGPVRYITSDTISRMKSLFCTLNENEDLNETLESLNEQVINSYKAMFLDMCRDKFVKQLLEKCDQIFKRFVCNLLSKSTKCKKSLGSWNVIGTIQIKSLNKEANTNKENIKDSCVKDPYYLGKHFRINITNIQSRDDVVLDNEAQGPSIILMLDRYGNYVKTIYPEEQNFEQITNFELLVVDTSIAKNKSKSKETSSASETEEHHDRTRSSLFESYQQFIQQNKDINFGGFDTKINEYCDKKISDMELLEKIQSTLKTMPTEDQIRIYNSLQSKNANGKFVELIDIPNEHKLLHSKEALRTLRLESVDSGIVSSTTVKSDGIEEISDTESVPSVFVKSMLEMKDDNIRSKSVETISSTNSEVEYRINKNNKAFYKRLPKGKLCYVREQNALFRYFDEAQINLFIENLHSSNKRYLSDIYRQCYDHKTDHHKEVIKLPNEVHFSNKETLDDAEEYVKEYNTVQKNVPQDFFWYYKYVTGYQIYKGNIPISFQTFLAMHNTNGLKLLFNSYLENLKRQFKPGVPD